MTETNPTSSPVAERLVAAIAVIALHFATLLMAIFVAVFVVSDYVRHYEELGVRLPALTELLIAFSYSVAQCWYLIIPATVVFDIVVIAMLSRESVKRRWMLSLYSHLWLLAVILFLFGVTICLAAALPV